MKDKVVIITGGTSGIGKAIAIAFAKRNARIVITGRNEQNLAETEQELKNYTSDVLKVQADVSIEKDCVRIVNETLNRFGQIDILINNAGISMRALFAEVDLEVLRKVMDTNFWGTVYCTKYAMKPILKSKGSIVGISSLAGIKGLPGRTGYSASKFAMHGFLESLRIENLKKGIHVLICCPGFTASNIRNTALSKDGSVQGESPRDEQKMMQPEEVAEKLIQAIEKRKNTLILTRQGKMMNLLNKFFPSLIDKISFNTMAKEPGSPLN